MDTAVPARRQLLAPYHSGLITERVDTNQSDRYYYYGITVTGFVCAGYGLQRKVPDQDITNRCFTGGQDLRGAIFGSFIIEGWYR